MKQRQVLLPLIALWVIVPLCSFAGEKLIPITDYGVNGRNTPTFMGCPMPVEFFTSINPKSLSSQQNYVAQFDLVSELHLDENGQLLVQRSEENTSVLYLVNQAEYVNNVVVSSVSSADVTVVHNFLIALDSGGYVSVDLSMLAKVDQFFIYSGQAYEAILVTTGHDAELVSENLKVRPPVEELDEEQSVAVNYCTGSRHIPIKVINALGDYSVSWARRVNTTTGHTNHNIMFPDKDTYYHLGAFNDSTSCKVTVQWTIRAKDGNNNPLTLRWDGLDDVVFNGATGTVICDWCDDPFWCRDYNLSCKGRPNAVWTVKLL